MIYNASEDSKIYMQTKTGMPESKAGNIIALILFGIIIMTFSYMFFFSHGSTPQTTKAHTPDAMELYVQAQQFVKQALKAPSTAEFPFDPISVGTDGNGLYQVESTVDAQNSFGAPIRSHWMLNMRLIEGKWVLETMQIDGKIVYDASTSN